MKHLYKPLLRPAWFGLPKGWDYVEAPDATVAVRRGLPLSSWRFGVIAYERQLTTEEVKQNDLEYMGVN